MRIDCLLRRVLEDAVRRLKVLVAACGLTLLAAVPAQAQLNGSHSLGDFGVQSGSQPQPGFYAALFYLRYDTDTIKDRDGNIVRPAPNSPGSIGLSAAAPILWYVSKARRARAPTTARWWCCPGRTARWKRRRSRSARRSTPASLTC